MTFKESGDYFFKKSLEEIPVLRKIREKKLIDLVILTGSFVRKNSDAISDIDLFIVLPLKVQKKFKLKPEYSFKTNISIKKILIEISFVTTEKLLNDQFTKQHIFWWNNAICIFFKNKTILSAFNRASRYTKEELKDKYWTLGFQFKLGMYDFEKISRRCQKDILTSSIIYFDSIRIFIEFYLLTNNVIRRFNWFSSELKKVDKKLFIDLDNVKYDCSARKQMMKKCNQIIDKKLLLCGFKKEDIVNWNKSNLTRLTFQKF